MSLRSTCAVRSRHWATREADRTDFATKPPLESRRGLARRRRRRLPPALTLTGPNRCYHACAALGEFHWASTLGAAVSVGCPAAAANRCSRSHPPIPASAGLISYGASATADCATRLVLWLGPPRRRMGMACVLAQRAMLQTGIRRAKCGPNST